MSKYKSAKATLVYIVMKKAFKIIGISFVIILALLVAIPFAFQGKIKDMVKVFINQNLNAKVDFGDVSLSFIKSFPEAHVAVGDIVVTNFEPFKDETFAAVKDIAFTMSIKELFKSPGDGPLSINSIYVNEALLTVKVDKFGHANYDIAKKTENEPVKETKTSDFEFHIKDYQIKNSVVTYIDEASNMLLHVTKLNHEGHGTFSAQTSELDTETSVDVSFSLDSVNYLTNNHIKLDAIIGLDLNANKYTFKNNKALINKLPLHFDGSVQLLDKGQKIDITFDNPESDFKNFLALIPDNYSRSLDGIKTSGNFIVKGFVKGEVTETTIPKLDITLLSNNASFKYPDLPKGVSNISINTNIKNTTGYLDDTYVDIKALNFKIDDDVFKSSAVIKNITKNMAVKANLDGVLNLENITKAYHVELDNALTGVLKAKLNTAFDMKAIENNAFDRIKNNGEASITDFVFSSEDIVNPIHISQAHLTFKTPQVSLNSFNAKTGASDLKANGTIDNLLGFLLTDGKLQGNFNLNSNLLKISDFMTEDETAEASNKSTSDAESLKIPDFLDCTIKANAKTVVYDNLNLKDVKGALLIKDQKATLKDMTSSLFNGALAISGNVSTKSTTPTFDMNLNAKEFDIPQSFKSLPLLQNIAPIAKILKGQLNTVINLSGDLDKEFLPNLNTITGKAFGELLNSSVTSSKTELLNKLEGSLKFVDFSKLNLKDLKTNVEFGDGKVKVKPFSFNYEDIEITVSGAHGFDKTLGYNAVFNVPAKYLGSDVNQLIGKLDSDADTKNLKVPVIASIGGSYTSPTVKTNLTQSVSNLTKQLVEVQKQKLLNKGKSKISDLLGNVLGNKEDASSTGATKGEQKETVVKDVLNGLIGGEKNKVKDSTVKSNPKNQVKDAVKGALGGLFGKKKK